MLSLLAMNAIYKKSGTTNLIANPAFGTMRALEWD
jgi:hypothetical protein